MPNIPKISLIMATYGRRTEVSNFLDSISKQTYPLECIEIIIVDQNNNLTLDDIVGSFNKRLKITHIKSKIKGLSANRNIGLDAAKGDIIAFPDDDCTYYPDTISHVINLFNRMPTTKIIMGSIFDKKTGVDLLRRWPKKRIAINKWNFYRLISSITIFSKLRNHRFDPKLGIGSYYGSNEDADYIYRSLQNGDKIVYVSSLNIWHPEQRNNILPKEKVTSYGLGFGAFVAKNISPQIIFLFLQSILFHTTILVTSLTRLNIKSSIIRAHAIYSRVYGLLHYNKARK
jgi:glycosyltransferase involved in cell wall biosynthesis